MFKNADCEEADFTGAELTGCDFSGANLVYADFTGTDLSNSILDGANVFEALIEEGMAPKNFADIVRKDDPNTSVNEAEDPLT